MQHANWQCPKCESTQFESTQMRTEGGILSSLFDVSTNSFSAVTCSRCTYTELYRTHVGGVEQVFDLFVT